MTIFVTALLREGPRTGRQSRAPCGSGHDLFVTREGYKHQYIDQDLDGPCQVAREGNGRPETGTLGLD
jgi:hypothetical protein